MENDGLMIVRKTIPLRYDREIVYVGEILELKDIPLKLRLEESEARNYYWIIHSFVKKGKELQISSGAYSYKELLKNEQSYGNRTYREILIPINPEVKKGLVGLLS